VFEVAGGWLGGAALSYTQRPQGQPDRREQHTPRSASAAGQQLQLRNGRPACAAGIIPAPATPGAEYGYSILDVPHRVILAPMVQLPFGQGHRYGAGWSEKLLGDWTVVAAITLQAAAQRAAGGRRAWA
jgi:hypothetical protein